MSLATEMNEQVKGLLELALTPIKIARSGGGDWTITNIVKNEVLGTFSEYSGLEKFLRSVGATEIPEDKLAENEVDMEIPAEAIRMEMMKKGEVGGGQNFK